MAITWTKYWSAVDNGTTLSGAHVRILQDDIDAGFEEALSDALSVALPAQTGFAGYLLTTDGTNASWGYGVLDEDNMVSDRADAVPTQQSTKEYVDTRVDTGHAHNGTTGARVAATDLLMTSITDQHVLYNNAGTLAGKVLSAAQVKIGQFTHNTSDASGDYSITGVGFQPSVIIFFIHYGGGTAASYAVLSFGLTNGTLQYNGGTTNSGASIVGFTSSAQIWVYAYAGTGYSHTAVIKTLDADGFTYTITRAGSSAADAAYTVSYLALR